LESVEAQDVSNYLLIISINTLTLTSKRGPVTVSSPLYSDI